MQHTNIGHRAIGLGTLAVILAALLFPQGVWAQDSTPAAKININTASAAELQKLPRVGEKVAQRIVDFRAQNGEFKKIEEIMKVRGIGEKIFLQLKDLITVGDFSN
jgi:competence protein ComEA